MARAAVRTSGARRRSSSRDQDVEGGSLASRIAGEVFGFALLSTAALTTLALATYSASDPILELGAVDNAAGPVGATLAGALVAAVGAASVVAVLALGWIGTRLVLSLGMPSATSRFWVGSVALLSSLTSLPRVIDTLSPGTFAHIQSGALGGYLVAQEQLLFGTYGALLVNSLLLVLGILCLLGISVGSAIWALAAASIVMGELAQRGAGAGLRGVRRAGEGAVRAGRSGLRHLHAGADAARLWRERRAVRARRAVPLAPIALPPVAQAIDASAQELATPPAAPADKLDPSGAPYIVDHDEERRAHFSPEQETFRFEEGGPRGPYRLPDVAIFHQPDEEGHAYDRDSLLMNSRILEKKLLDFGVAGRVVRVHPGPVVTMYEYSPAPGSKGSASVPRQREPQRCSCTKGSVTILRSPRT